VGNSVSIAEMKLGNSFCGLSTVMRIPTTRTKPEFNYKPVQVEFVVDKLAFEWGFSEYFGYPIHIFLPKLHSYV
jgi:hypothetical protein